MFVIYMIGSEEDNKMAMVVEIVDMVGSRFGFEGTEEVGNEVGN